MAHKGDLCAHLSAQVQRWHHAVGALPSHYQWQFNRMITVCPIFKKCITFIVHVGWHLHHAEAEVDGQVIKVIIRLQDKLSAELHAVPIVIHLVYQHCVKILILYGKSTRFRYLTKCQFVENCSEIHRLLQCWDEKLIFA